MLTARRLARCGRRTAARRRTRRPWSSAPVRCARRSRVWPVARACGWAHGASGRDDELTRREIDVLRLLADGLTNRQIAERLFISEKTVGTHVAHIFSKLDVHTRVEAASRAHALGVLSST